MRSWTTDAKDIGEIEENDLVQTPSIKDFLNIDDKDKYYYVVAPKGIGKTLLLMYKRRLYDKKHKKSNKIYKKNENEEILLIPKDQELDRAYEVTDLSLEKMDLLNDHNYWKKIWKVSISLTLIKNSLRYRKVKEFSDERDHRKISSEEANKNLLKALKRISQKGLVCDAIKKIIINTDMLSSFQHLDSILLLSYDDIIKCTKLQNEISFYLKDNIRWGMAYFLDNTDQCFDEYLQKRGENASFYKNMWYLSQIGLMLAIYELSAISPHIKIFTSIRKEAFQEMVKKSSLSMQLEGETLDITYTRRQLEDIFLKNIKCMNKFNLAHPERLLDNPYYSFLGLDNNIIGRDENIFDYIYRHTLKRPRDLMAIGRALQQTDKSERNEKNIRDVINQASYGIAKNFLGEIKPFSEINDFDLVFSKIHTNILTRQDIFDICRLYNKESCCKESDCKSCDFIHVFCDLYKFGLLGIIKPAFSGDMEKQEFVRIGDIPNESKTLPHSKFYFVHPILNERIRQANMKIGSNYIVNKDIIIGDGYNWNDHLIDIDKKRVILSETQDVDPRMEPSIGIMTALPIECNAVEQVLEYVKPFAVPGIGAGRKYKIGRIPSINGGDHHIVLSCGDKGNNLAASRATLMIEHFPTIKYIIMVGIAGGVPNPDKPDVHVRLGDVVVSDNKGVIQYDFGKELKTDFLHDHNPRAPSAELLEAVKLLEAHAIQGKKPWLNYIKMSLHPGQENDKLLDSKNPKKIAIHPHDPKRIKKQPRIFLGTIAAGNRVEKNPETRDYLRDKFGVRAIEMEGSGIADATWINEKGYLIIRGISDYCDPNKRDEWQNYASMVAAAYMRALIESIPKT